MRPGDPKPKAGSARTGPLPLHPMSLGDIIDGVFRLVRANVLVLAPTLMLVALPFQALIAYAGRNNQSLVQILSNLGSLQGQRSTTIHAGDLVLTYLGELGLFLVMPVVAGMVARTVAASYRGEQLSAGEAAALGGRAVVALLVASVLGHLLEVAGFCLCFLPCLVFMAFLFLTGPAIALEGLGPMAGLRRSWRLVRGRFWPVLGTMLLGILLGEVSVGIVSLVPDALAQLAPPHVRAVIDAVIGTAGSAFEWAIYANLASLIYLDQRIRQEGLDLEVMAAQAR
jgi:hypothetical protein